MLMFGSLFAGIGGIDLGLERAGMRCVWQVEIDDYATKVLEKHWPDVRRWRDVSTFPLGSVDEWRCDLIAGGFPCQDISYAGKGAGLDGERSGLWWEFARVVRALEPRFVLVENVGALLARGIDDVLGTLASLGYDAEWHCIPAAAVGAPHRRDRLFILAYTHRIDGGFRGCGIIQDCNKTLESQVQRWAAIPVESANGLKMGWNRGAGGQWRYEPDVGRVADGVPSRVDRLRCLGNAVVPQVAEWIGKQIIKHAGEAMLS